MILKCNSFHCQTSPELLFNNFMGYKLYNTENTFACCISVNISQKENHETLCHILWSTCKLFFWIHGCLYCNSFLFTNCAVCHVQLMTFSEDLDKSLSKQKWNTGEYNKTKINKYWIRVFSVIWFCFAGCSEHALHIMRITCSYSFDWLRD